MRLFILTEHMSSFSSGCTLSISALSICINIYLHFSLFFPFLFSLSLSLFFPFLDVLRTFRIENSLTRVFPLRPPFRVSSSVVGCSRPPRVTTTLSLFSLRAPTCLELLSTRNRESGLYVVVIVVSRIFYLSGSCFPVLWLPSCDVWIIADVSVFVYCVLTAVATYPFCHPSPPLLRIGDSLWTRDLFLPSSPKMFLPATARILRSFAVHPRRSMFPGSMIHDDSIAGDRCEFLD